MPGGDGLNSPRSKPSEVPDEIGFPDKYKMRNTRCLIVTMKNISDVPEHVLETAGQQNVSTVDFSNNQLKKLPTGLIHLSNSCMELMLSKNSLEFIDSFISEFSKLVSINLACNKLFDLPIELGQVTTLREININHNRFENIPLCIYSMKNLEILYASDNRIKTIDATENGLCALKRLAKLDLRNNDIAKVPPTLGNLENIIELEIVGNPFRNPRVQIIQKGTDAIMSYLRGRIP